MGILKETIKRGDTRMSTSADKKKQIGWAVSILIPFIIAFIPVSGDFTESLKRFFMITLFMILIIAFELFPLLVSAILLPSLVYCQRNRSGRDGFWFLVKYDGMDGPGGTYLQYGTG